MPLLVPDPAPPTFKDRLSAACIGLFLLACAIFLLWDAPRLADPAWTPSTWRLRHLAHWTPFWRGAVSAILGSWTLAFSLVAFWKSVRPFTPA